MKKNVEKLKEYKVQATQEKLRMTKRVMELEERNERLKNDCE